MKAFCLSVHAPYGCEHAGACCTEGWPIPIEPAAVRQLATRALAGCDAPSDRVVEDAGGLIVATRAGGACAFFEPDSRLCSIHRHAGPELLPSACRQFPRVALRDPRGLFITLSHFCPTAARLLLRVVDIAIVEAPPSLSLDGGAEGLDATDVLPPLLRPGMLTDYDGYSAWERAAVAVFDSDACSVRQALAVIRGATDRICRWRPAEGALSDFVAAAFAEAMLEPRAAPRNARARLDRPVKAFLASHLFASWAGYQQGGLTAIVDELDAVCALLGPVGDEQSFVAAVRAADRLLRHTGDHVRSRPLSPLR